jgi:hypothetical protein
MQYKSSIMLHIKSEGMTGVGDQYSTNIRAI